MKKTMTNIAVIAITIFNVATAFAVVHHHHNLADNALISAGGIEHAHHLRHNAAIDNKLSASHLKRIAWSDDHSGKSKIAANHKKDLIRSSSESNNDVIANHRHLGAVAHLGVEHLHLIDFAAVNNHHFQTVTLHEKTDTAVIGYG